jgi:hypothetical protein
MSSEPKVLPFVYVLIPTTAGRRNNLIATIDSVRKNTFPHAIVIYENQDGGYVPAVHNMLLGINALVFIINDDMTIGSFCLATLYDEYIKRYPNFDGLLQPLEQFGHGRNAVSPFCHSDVLKKYLFKGYKHNFCDTELVAVMSALKKYAYVPTAIMFHNHFKITRKIDDTYKISQATFKQDRQLYFQRKANGFEPKNK